MVVVLDAYDALGISVDADQAIIKKAYRKLSLQHHPDKILANGGNIGGEEAFQQIKEAYDILQDANRRKVYDAFGVDLGAESPEKEVWSIGVSSLVTPMSSFTMKTVVTCIARWLAQSFTVKVSLTVCCVLVGLLHLKKVPMKLGSWEALSSLGVLINLGVGGVLIGIHWIWPLLFDSVCILYLVSEVAGVEMLVTNSTVFGCVGFGAMVLAWLVRRWWTWIIGLEVAISVIALFACGLAAGVLRIYIGNIAGQHGQKIKDKRQLLRRERTRLEDEAARLKSRLLPAPRR